MSTHAVHFPHCGSIGTPVGLSGASVRTVTHRTRGPCSGVTSRQPLPDPAQAGKVRCEFLGEYAADMLIVRPF
ncbi:MAG: hypothetical protein MZV70_30260 [Desulfobacterales bacterium]|nr:hypothetical protein [Desulfobacterales bacterium]